jgi:hypothetical protein
MMSWVCFRIVKGVTQEMGRVGRWGSPAPLGTNCMIKLYTGGYTVA